MATELCTVGKNPTFSFHSNHILQINVYTRITLPKLEVFKLWKIEERKKLKIEGFLPCVQRIVVVRRQQHRFLKSLFM